MAMDDIPASAVTIRRSVIHRAAQAAVNFVYPPACPFCGNEADSVAAKSGFAPVLCADCQIEVVPPIDNACGRCGAPVGPYLETRTGCVHCRNDRFQFDSVYSIGVYANALKRACLRAKTKTGRPLAAALAGILWERHAANLLTAKIDVVVAVPRHWMKRLATATNAAETLAESLAGRLQVNFGRHILAKVRRTPDQSQLPPYRRRSNLRRAFRVRDNLAIQNATVLLVDDILTTGTTANEVSRVLRKAGAKRVIVAVPARGIGR